MGRLNVPSWLINLLGYNQSTRFICDNHGILLAGTAPRRENSIARWKVAGKKFRSVYGFKKNRKCIIITILRVSADYMGLIIKSLILAVDGLRSLICGNNHGLLPRCDWSMCRCRELAIRNLLPPLHKKKGTFFDGHCRHFLQCW